MQELRFPRERIPDILRIIKNGLKEESEPERFSSLLIQCKELENYAKAEGLIEEENGVRYQTSQ